MIMSIAGKNHSIRRSDTPYASGRHMIIQNVVASASVPSGFCLLWVPLRPITFVKMTDSG